MVGINDAQLDRMRTQVESLLPGTAVIQSASLASDGAGGWGETWAAVTSGTVSCRIDPAVEKRQIDITTGRETLALEWTLTLPYDAPIAANRRVVIAGRTYEVIALHDVHSWNVSRRAVVSEVR